MNRYIKRLFLLLIICLAAGTAKAQMGYDYAQYDLGISYDMNKAYTDAETVAGSKSVHFNFNYNVSPFVNYVFELQSGEIKGGDSVLTKSGRQFTNQYTAFIFRGQLQGGEIIDYSQSKVANFLKNLYASAGVGYIVNHMTTINRYSIKLPGFYTPGDDNSNELMIPARIGYEIKFFNRYDQPCFKVDLGYQYNFIMGDDLDGFVIGSGKDSYSQLSIGIKFAVGGLASYRKPIHF